MTFGHGVILVVLMLGAFIFGVFMTDKAYQLSIHKWCARGWMTDTLTCETAAKATKE